MDHTTYKILSDYLSKGIYPDNLHVDKTEKRSIRSQAIVHSSYIAGHEATEGIV